MRTISLRSAASSSRTLLLASTTSAGSMNTVFPVADSSWTMPLILRFSPGATGIIRRPSRRVGATSWATRPSRWVECSIVYKVREIDPAVCSISWRIPASVIDAESLILPNLSKMESMRRMIAGNVSTSSAMRCRAGYRNSGFSSSPLFLFRNATIMPIVSSERRRSKSSSSSMWVFSMRSRATDSRTSKK